MKIFIGADHRGFVLKESLRSQLAGEGHEVVDCGANALVPDDDYPEPAFAVARAMAREEHARGILLCGSGVGVCIVANRVVGIRAALACAADTVRAGRTDDDINVLCLSADVMNDAQALSLIQIFLSESFSGDERHVRRITAIDAA